MLMPLTAFAKRFILGFWQGSEYSSAIKYISMEANLVNKIWWGGGRGRALSNTWMEHGWGPQEKGKYIVKYLNRFIAPALKRVGSENFMKWETTPFH